MTNVVVDGRVGRPCSRFDCTCVCDVSAGSCDANCCCDVECAADATARARSAGTCLPEGPANNTVLQCVEVDAASTVAAINPKARMYLQDQSVRGLEGVVCIAVDNNPIAGTFFPDPGFPGPGVFSRVDVASAPTFASVASLPTTSTLTVGAITQTAVYLPRSPILAARVVAGPALQYDGNAGAWQVPSADAGACDGTSSSSTSFVRMGEDRSPASSCIVRSPITDDECAALAPQSLLGVAATASAATLRVASVPSAPISSPSDVTWLAPTVTRIRLVDPETGAVLTESLDPATVLAVTPTDPSRFDNTTCTCLGAAVAATVTLSHNGAGTLTSVTVAMDVADLRPSSCAVRPSVRQTVSVQFAAATISDRSRSANNLVPRDRSGNPGYTRGAPVQAGQLVTDGTRTAISAATTGLALRGPGEGGACARVAGNTVPVAVRFDEDVSIGCSVRMSVAELRALCTAGGVAPWLGLNATHLGLFGNADPLRTTHWLAIDATEAVASPTFDESALACRSAIVASHLRVLVAPVGEVQNPQLKIIAASLVYSSGDLVAQSPGGVTSFHFQNAATFTTVSSSSLDRFIPPPPSVVELPHDLFYPFQVNDVAPAAGAATPATALVPLVSGVTMVALLAIVMMY